MEEDKKNKVFDYKAIAQRMSPRNGMENKNLIKCG